MPTAAASAYSALPRQLDLAHFFDDAAEEDDAADCADACDRCYRGARALYAWWGQRMVTYALDASTMEQMRQAQAAFYSADPQAAAEAQHEQHEQQPVASGPM